MKQLLVLSLAVFFIIEVDCRPDVRRPGRFVERIKALVNNMTCEEKEPVFEAYLDQNRTKLEDVLHTLLPRPPHFGPRRVQRRRRVRERLHNKTCEQKSWLFDMMLERDAMAPRQNKSNPNPRSRRPHVPPRRGKFTHIRNRAMHRMKNMSCEQKVELFEARLALDRDRQEMLLGLQYPKRRQNPNHGQRQRKLALMRHIGAQLDGKSCEEKVQIFHALLTNNHERIHELGIELPDDVGYRGRMRVMKGKIREQLVNMSCPEKQAVFEAFLDGDDAAVKSLTGVQMPAVPEHIRQRRQHKMGIIRARIQGKSCVRQMFIFDTILSDQPMRSRQNGRKHSKHGQNKHGRSRSRQFGRQRKGEDQIYNVTLLDS